jgi:mono/diheme cytochrome c family protein
MFYENSEQTLARVMRPTSMPWWRLYFGLAVIALSLSIAAAGCAKRSRSKSSFVTSQATTVNASTGKQIFVARCGSCHSEHGEKPLRVGLPLNQRELSREVVAKAVQGRLKDKSDAERQAVVDYILSLRVAPKP